MENKAFEELLESVIKGLTDEQKKKAEACKDVNELIALLGKLGVDVPDKLMDAVAGGITYPKYTKRFF